MFIRGVIESSPVMLDNIDFLENNFREEVPHFGNLTSVSLGPENLAVVDKTI